MKAELRADGLHISGYVNVPGRMSRPVITSRGKVIEVIEQRSFAKAIEKAGEIRMLLDHESDRVLASTADGTLMVKEDAVGLRAESIVTDEDVIDGAKKGKLRGWSFNMRNIVDSLEQRAEGELPIRHVTDFDMDEVTIVMNKIPVYSSTSVEVRAGEELDTEQRASIEDLEYQDFTEVQQEERADEGEPDPEPDPEPAYDNSAFFARFKSIKK